MQWSQRWDWDSGALLFLICAAAIRIVGTGLPLDDRRARRSAQLVRRVWWCALLITWAAFWLEDLRHARFSVTLLSIPTAALSALALCLVCRGALFLRVPSSWTGAVAVGVGTGLGLVYSIMISRAHNGCIGISTSYQRTQCVTSIALYLLGPAMLAPYFSALFACPNWLRRHVRVK